MGSAFHQLCPRYSGTLTPTAPTAIKLWDTFTFTFLPEISCVLYIGLLWDIIHSGLKICAYRIHIVGSETFKRICLEKYSEGLRYC